MRLTTTATFAGVITESLAPDYQPTVLLVYRLPGGEYLKFPPEQPRSVGTLLKNAPKKLTITAEEEK